MSHAAGGSLFVIGGAVAVMAQNNGKYIEPLMPQESYDNEMRSHGNSPGEEYANFKKEFDEEVKEIGRALFYKKNGYQFDDVGSNNATKVETTRGVPLEFSPFWNPLSLTPVVSHTLMTKIWYYQELYKRSFLMQIAKVRITSPYQFSARWTESRNPIKPTHVERTRGR